MSFHRGSPHTASPGLSNEMSLSVTIRCHGSYLRGLEQGSRSGGPAQDTARKALREDGGLSSAYTEGEEQNQRS